jgi:hypothetical protein
MNIHQEKDSRVYINGRLEGASTPVLNIPKISSLWIGGWYRNYNFVGAVDEVRISKVVRSADWVKLQYENQQPLQTLVGPMVQAGSELGRVTSSAHGGRGQARDCFRQGRRRPENLLDSQTRRP